MRLEHPTASLYSSARPVSYRMLANGLASASEDTQFFMYCMKNSWFVFPGQLTQLSWAAPSNTPEKFVIHDQQSASFAFSSNQESSLSHLVLLAITVCLPGIVKAVGLNIQDDGARPRFCESLPVIFSFPPSIPSSLLSKTRSHLPQASLEFLISLPASPEHWGSQVFTVNPKFMWCWESGGKALCELR